MATYNAAAVADATIAYEKPITLQQGRALRDNPLAVFEHASGAPRIKQRIRGGNSAGGSVTFTGLGEYAGAVLTVNAANSGAGTYGLDLEFSTDGTTWLAGTTILSESATYAKQINLWVDFDSGDYDLIEGVNHTSGTAAGASLSVVSMRVRSTIGAVPFAVMAEFNGGIV
jgi:hypothetical protein